jgi:hypothetical protein
VVVGVYFWNSRNKTGRIEIWYSRCLDSVLALAISSIDHLVVVLVGSMSIIYSVGEHARVSLLLLTRPVRFLFSFPGMVSVIYLGSHQ